MNVDTSTPLDSHHAFFIWNEVKLILVFHFNYQSFHFLLPNPFDIHFMKQAKCRSIIMIKIMNASASIADRNKELEYERFVCVISNDDANKDDFSFGVFASFTLIATLSFNKSNYLSSYTYITK